MSSAPRYHHLDALRATAMLLGIVMHGLLSFFENDYWPAQDLQQHELYETVNHAIHGFRMPLFFLISGYFTTMLWKRRGLGKLLQHRVQRILLPLVIGGMVFIPLTWVASMVGEHLTSTRAPVGNGNQSTTSSRNEPGFWAALRSGDVENLRLHLQDGTDPDSRDDKGQPALTIAVWANQPGSAELLLAGGADPNVRDDKGYTPLHAAAFLGRAGMARSLVENGADVNSSSAENKRPLDSARENWKTVEWIASIIKVEVDREEVMRGRKKLDPYLVEQGAVAASPLSSNALIGIYTLLAMVPLTAHLWFLYYLLMLVAGFAIASLLVTAWKIPPLPGWLLSAPGCLLVLVPLTAIAQFFMRQSFGPDTAMGILPWPPKLLYYALFFGFGAICFGRPEFEEKLGRWWPLSLLLSIPLLLYGLHLFEQGLPGTRRIIFSLCAALYTWLMILGFLGIFRQFFARKNAGIRYVSDASYWMYLAHLPLIMILQALVTASPLPSLVKFTLICLVSFAFLLLTYRYLVRYTIIGTMLNGKRVRVPPLPPAGSPPLPAPDSQP